MTQEFIVRMVVQQVGEEKAKEILDMVLSMAEKMGDDQIYVLKKLKGKGVTLISTNSKDCVMNFPNATKEKPPSMFELEKIVKNIEI